MIKSYVQILSSLGDQINHANRLQLEQETTMEASSNASRCASQIHQDSRLRVHQNNIMNQAKKKTLQMTIVIVVAFLVLKMTILLTM